MTPLRWRLRAGRLTDHQTTAFSGRQRVTDEGCTGSTPQRGVTGYTAEPGSPSAARLELLASPRVVEARSPSTVACSASCVAVQEESNRSASSDGEPGSAV